ncbi:hypothetical protein K4K49_003925 [Colletotrichum sp. SAR 10_70]|nr:hypothetical protein K4K50_004698 [Colletotrichum sp. SAR 10_71]KAI8198809.1 hypothetical protein K4K49_003925 [Colletotrichum sp. SAR 10_70]KAI8213794.1 hypothetical protein K4K52_003798 [Colletotrichum sp. SAR 10_76]KAI8234735.1 hypothetical protein K4K54_007809 [Colletotrichum sp. SAR 10_86]KAJ4999503.1 hypothetical protein K4K48_004029 [Colletotrichum sp. SAR 10_66]
MYDYNFMLASMHQELDADALDLYEKVLSPLSEDLRNRIVQRMRYYGSNIKKAVQQVLLEDLESRRRQQAGTQGPMTLPSGSKVMSPGHVQLAFSFDGETEKHDLICSILPGATRDLVLGSLFLKATRTMTDFAHRIKKIIRCLANPSLNLIGAEQDFLGGYINGTECLAVPDTGSDVMAISLKHARRLGLKVHRRERHRTLVEFLDGSRVLTNGVAQAEWQFAYGEPTIRCDFHVIKGLPVDAILSNTLLDEHDAFSRYEERIQSAERLNSTMGLGIYGISLVEVCEQKLRSLSDSYLDDIKSENPFTRDKVERERARRDEIRDAIAQIPDEALRATKQHQEYLRKRLWDELRKPHLEANVQDSSKKV